MQQQYPNILQLLTQIKTIFLEELPSSPIFDQLLEAIDHHIERLQPLFEKYPIHKKLSIEQASHSCSSSEDATDTAAMIDFFVLECNLQTKEYALIGRSVESEIQQQRQALRKLIITDWKYHIEAKKKTRSMTDLHRITSHPSPSTHPLILPNHSNIDKYVFIYESQECVEDEGKYWLVDRYYLFVVEGFCSEGIHSLLQTVQKKAFEHRLLAFDSSEYVRWSEIQNCFLSRFEKLQQIVFRDCLPICQLPTYKFPDRLVAFCDPRMQQFPLIILLFYLILKEYKICLISSKQKNYRISEVMGGIEKCLHPLKYVYPIVYACLGRESCQFAESPIPLFLGYWGHENRKRKFLHYWANQQTQTIPSILLDIDQMKVLSWIPLQVQDTFALEKLNAYIHQYGRGTCYTQKLNNFLLHELITTTSSPSNSKWLTLLKQSLKRSQLYEAYTNI